MKCTRCNNYIPNSVGNCPECCMFYDLSTKNFPSQDKYGFVTKEIPIDIQKRNTREKYIETEKRKNTKTEKMRFESNEKYVMSPNLEANIKIIPSILYFYFFLSAFIGCCLVKPQNLKVPTSIIIFIVLSIATFVAFEIAKKKDRVNFHLRKSIKRHTSYEEFTIKNTYYESQNVIGYSVFDHTKFENEQLRDYYIYYEIDRKNIKEIAYDAQNAGYIINTIEPVYWHYQKPKTTTIFFADIFDDTVLTNALQHNLPPKNMNF